MKPKEKLQPPLQLTWEVLGILGAILLGLCLLAWISFQPMPGTVYGVVLIFILLFIGLGLLAAAGIAHFLDHRSDWLEQ